MDDAWSLIGAFEDAVLEAHPAKVFHAISHHRWDPPMFFNVTCMLFSCDLLGMLLTSGILTQR